MITVDNMIAGTADGAAFFGAGIDVLHNLTADQDIIGWDDHL